MASIKRIFDRLYQAYQGFAEHDGTMLAAAIAYYLAFSLFPMMMVLVAGLGWAFRATEIGQDAQQKVYAAIAEQASPALSEEIREALGVVEEKSLTSGAVGVLVLVVAAVAIFSQLDYAFDRLWDKPAGDRHGFQAWLSRLLSTRFKALLMLMGVGAFVIAVMITSIVWQGVQSATAQAMSVPAWVQQAMQPMVHVLLNVIAFAALYAFVPKTHVRLKAALAGGVLAAGLWEIGRQLLAAYVLRRNLPTAYGLIGSFMAIMLWTYYAMIVVLFGAAYARVINEQPRDAPLDRP